MLMLILCYFEYTAVVKKYKNETALGLQLQTQLMPQFAEVSGGRVRGRPRLGWMDGVKVALGNRGMTVEAARQYAKDRKAWRALVHM